MINYRFLDIVIKTNSPLGTFLSYLYLFIIGSFMGWLIEILFRRIFTQHKWTNPGFLKGPCLPLYGFGLCLLYLICSLSFKYLCNGEGIPDYYSVSKDMVFSGSLNFTEASVVAILAIGVGMTLLEFVAGIIFIKGFRIKLWDYSSLKGNIMGIICPLFSAIWLAVGAIFWFFIEPYVIGWLDFFNNHMWVITFILGIYLGILSIDVVTSIKLASKVSGIAKKNKFVVDFSKFQSNLSKNKIFKKRNKNWVEEQAELAASKLKTKIGDLTYDIKRHMYVGNVMPTTSDAASDETPRTKAEKVKNKNDINISDKETKTIENQKNNSKVNNRK
ncbi:MAG: putative ABC transporter permease [Bacilli bacterium]|jgi:uncharacterized membrane protein